jgi:hypothetical protein
MSENVVVYFFKVGKRQGLERLFGTSKAFITLYDRSRGWAKGEGRSLPQFIGAINDGCYAFGNRGVRPVPLYQKLAKAKTYSLKTVFVKLRNLCHDW